MELLRLGSSLRQARPPPVSTESLVLCSSSSSGRNVFAVEDPQRLLQRLNLLLAAGDAVVVAHTRVHARGLELVEVGERGVELLLGALEVRGLDGVRLRLVLLLGRLVLYVRRLRGLVHPGVGHEDVVLFLRGGFCCLCVCLQAGKVGLDDLQHADHAPLGALHAPVGRVEDLGRLRLLLQQGRGLARPRVELPQHCERLRQGGLRVPRVLDGLGVRGPLLLTELRGRGHRLVQLGHGLRERGDVLRELGDGCLELVDLCVQGLHGLRLFLPRLLVGGELSVAPALVLGLFVGLLHEAREEVLDHLLHPAKGVVGHAAGQHREDAAVEVPSPGLQVRGRPRLDLAPEVGPQSRQRRGLLRQGRQVPVCAARHRLAGDDLDGLVEGHKLL
mmetsp:Transcript_29540/g.84861  ORF Transcript_29540/g.84861 Transcript_29540/m.84861 type:complete len:389 (-) Transcript_29540:1064-2230(-)